MTRPPRSRTRRAVDASALQVLGDGSVQGDLFGLVDAELASRADADRRRAEFEARARWMPDGSPVEWTAVHDHPLARRGQTVPGWRCWLCGDVVATAYVLGRVHGLHPDDPDVLTRTTCTHQTPAAPPCSEGDPS